MNPLKDLLTGIRNVFYWKCSQFLDQRGINLDACGLIKSTSVLESDSDTERTGYMQYLDYLIFNIPIDLFVI
jgi:hypothetical protein